MTKEQLELLFQYIEARIDAYNARHCEDGGLAESIRANAIKQELRESLSDSND